MQQLIKSTNEGRVKFQPGFNKRISAASVQSKAALPLTPALPIYIGGYSGTLIQTYGQEQPVSYSAMLNHENITGWVYSVAASLAQIPQGKPASNRQRTLLAEQGGYISAVRTAELLNCSIADIEAKRSEGELIGILTNNGYVYPAWQFDNGNILKGLPEILEILKPIDSWMKLSFMLRKSERLNDTPLNALRKHRFDEVKSIASIFGEQGAV